MTALVTALVGTGAVPAAAGAMGPLLPTAGLIGSGGALTLSGLATGFSLASIATSFIGSNSAANAQTAQARQEASALRLSSESDLLDAKQAELQGKQEANDIMDRLKQALASQRLAASANGIDPSFGTPVSVAESTRDLAETQLNTSRENTRILAASRRSQAYARLEESANRLNSGYASSGATRVSGLTSAAQAGASAILRRYERG